MEAAFRIWREPKEAARKRKGLDPDKRKAAVVEGDDHGGLLFKGRQPGEGDEAAALHPIEAGDEPLKDRMSAKTADEPYLESASAAFKAGYVSAL